MARMFAKEDFELCTEAQMFDNFVEDEALNSKFMETLDGISKGSRGQGQLNSY